jgi:uncharacterized protein (TIGR02145 family)
MRKTLMMCVLAGAVWLLGCVGKDAADKATSAADTAAKQPPSISTFTDSRDGKVYNIAQIGSQTWFAENLNYAAKGSKCYENSADSCEKYGRLYDWAAANKACPAGFHLPNDEEWGTLVDYARGAPTLKTPTEWTVMPRTTIDFPEKSGTFKFLTGWWRRKPVINEYDLPGSSPGTDDFGFSALPAGCCRRAYNGGDDFTNAGLNAFWWTATNVYWAIERERGDTASNVYVRHMSYFHDGVSSELINKNEMELYSVRCVQDDEEESQK